MATALTPAPTAAEPRHGELIDLYLLDLSCEVAPDTVRNYASALRRAHDALPAGLPLATTSELQAWISTFRAPSTRRTYRAAIRGFTRWAVRLGEIDFDAGADLSRVRVPRGVPKPTTDEQTRIIVTQAEEPVRLWSILMAYAGLRCCEVALLDRDHVNEQWIEVTGKGGHQRIVPTHPLIWAAVCDLPHGLIAEGATRQRISKRCAKEYHRLGLHLVTAHRLRHWAGTQWLAATRDLRLVQQLMGHASPSTTAGYTLVATEAMQAAVAAVPVW
jgi:integrase/recombinase XerC